MTVMHDDADVFADHQHENDSYENIARHCFRGAPKLYVVFLLPVLDFVLQKELLFLEGAHCTNTKVKTLVLYFILHFNEISI